MAKDKNRFGGIAKSNYTPLSEIEQEAISRLVDARSLRIIIKGWGVVERPRVVFGDLRLGIAFRMNFSKPEFPTPVHFFDLELRTHSGILLFAERQSAMYDGKPVTVCQGMFLDMVWDIDVMAIDPKIVKALVPGALGLTSRFQDRDTGELSLFGNNRMRSEDRAELIKLRQGEAAVRADNASKAKKSEEAMYAAGINLDTTNMT